MKPLDIRIVDFIEALNQAGIDPAQPSVKRIIEALLMGWATPADGELSQQQIQDCLDLTKTGKTPQDENPTLQSADDGVWVDIDGDKQPDWLKYEDVQVTPSLKSGDCVWWEWPGLEGKKVWIESISDEGYRVVTGPGETSFVAPLCSLSPLFQVGDKVWWNIGGTIKEGFVHPSKPPHSNKLYVRVLGEDPPYLVSKSDLNDSGKIAPFIESRKDSQGRTFKSGDKVWYWDTRMEARVHGIITGFKDYEGGEGAWRHCTQSCKKAVVKATSISPLNHPDVMSVRRYPELDRLHHDPGDIVDECEGLSGLRLKLGAWVKWHQESWPRDPHGVLIGFQPALGLLAVVYYDGEIKYLNPASLIVVPDEDDADSDEPEEDNSEPAQDVPNDEQWYVGDCVWFWDPLEKHIIKGFIYKTDDIEEPNGTVFINRTERPFYSDECRIDALHRNEGTLITENKNIGTLVEWDSDFWGRCSGTIVGYLKDRKGSRAIIVEDDRHHPDWPADKYILHFVHHSDVYRSGESYPLD